MVEQSRGLFETVFADSPSIPDFKRLDEFAKGLGTTR
jgi:hypothetical protein